MVVQRLVPELFFQVHSEDNKGTVYCMIFGGDFKKCM